MNMNGLMMQAQNMQRQLAKKQKEIEEKEFVVSSNGGAITVNIMGNKKINKIQVDEDLLSDKEMLEDLLVVAINEAISKVSEEMEKAMATVTGGMHIPGMF